MGRPPGALAAWEAWPGLGEVGRSLAWGMAGPGGCGVCLGLEKVPRLWGLLQMVRPDKQQSPLPTVLQHEVEMDKVKGFFHPGR